MSEGPQNNTTDDRAVEASPRRRGRRWLWVLVPLVVLLMIPAAPLVWIRWQVRDVPDIGHPFDVEAIMHIDIPDDQNAFVKYREAVRLLVMPVAAKNVVGSVTIWEDLDALDQLGWEATTPAMRRALQDNRLALATWREGTERSEAIEHQPEVLRPSTRLETTQELRQFLLLSSLEAVRLRSEGKIDEAWEWHRAALRCGQHLGMHAGVLPRLTGNAFHAVAGERALNWAADPRVTADQLRTALADLQAIDDSTHPTSEMVQVEYIYAMNMLENMSPEIADGLKKPQIAENLYFVDISGERELSRRAIRLVFANWLSQADRPLSERSPIVTSNYGLYDVAPGDSRSSTLESPHEIMRILARTQIASEILPAFEVVIQIGEPRMQARRHCFRVAFAAQLHFREHGEFPASLEDLVGHGLDAIPEDPFGGGEPMRYQRDPDPRAGAKVWTIDRDQVDEDGEITPPAREADWQDLGYRIRPLEREPTAQ